MSGLAGRAERIKLARLLHRKPEQLAALEACAPEDLKRLRERVASALFDQYGDAFRRVAATTGVVPAGLAAQIGHRVFGPMLCARVAGHMQAAKAAEVAAKLPIEFLADVCLEMDPRRARAVIAGIPVAQVMEVARVLARRREFITMGRFVDALGDRAIRAVIEALPDDAALLEIAFFIESPQRLEAALRGLPDARLHGLMRTAVNESATLWPEAVALTARLPAPMRKRIIEAAARQEPALLAQMLECVAEQDLWDVAEPLLLQIEPLIPNADKVRLMRGLQARGKPIKPESRRK